MRWRDLDNVLNTSRDGMASAESSWVTQAFYQRLHSELSSPPPKKNKHSKVTFPGDLSHPWDKGNHPKLPETICLNLNMIGRSRYPRGVTPNSVIAVVPTMMAPASRKRRTTVLSWKTGQQTSRKPHEPFKPGVISEYLDEKMVIINCCLHLYYISVWACFHHQQYSHSYTYTNWCMLT